MKYGFVIDGGDARTNSELAQDAEAANWDGVFIADAVDIGFPNAPPLPWFDPWIVLAAMAMRTEHLRIGTMITPVSRRRPWKLARETVTLDHLSNGRLIFGVGLGAAEDDGGFFKVGEAMDIKVRAELLDEGLAIVAGLWSAKPFKFSGRHYYHSGNDHVTRARSVSSNSRLGAGRLVERKIDAAHAELGRDHSSEVQIDEQPHAHGDQSAEEVR